MIVYGAVIKLGDNYSICIFIFVKTFVFTKFFISGLGKACICVYVFVIEIGSVLNKYNSYGIVKDCICGIVNICIMDLICTFDNLGICEFGNKYISCAGVNVCICVSVKISNKYISCSFDKYPICLNLK